MSMKLNLVNGLLYTESEDVVTILENELADHGTTISGNMVLSESQEVVSILRNASATIEKGKCVHELNRNEKNSETTRSESIYFKSLSHPSADEDEEDTKKLIEWLKEAGLSNLFPYLKDAKVTFDSLRYLDKEDIREAIPPIGIRAKFRSKLFAWRKEKFGIEDDADSLKSEIRRWVHDSSLNSTSSARSPVVEVSYSNGCLHKDLPTLLAETSKGRALDVLDVYATKQGFQNCNRNELINIIVEETNCRNIHLRPHDFTDLVADICKLFPKEMSTQDYYFIPRKGRKNPSGKLYTKYVNTRVKKRKMDCHPLSDSADIMKEAIADVSEESCEVDYSVASALKASLRRDTSNWNEVSEKWEKTFSIRRKELKTLSNIEFLKAWPIYTDARSPVAIKQ